MKKYKNLLKYFQYDFCNKYYTKVKNIYIFLNNNYDKFNDIKTYGLYNAIDSYHEYYNNDIYFINSIYTQNDSILFNTYIDVYEAPVISFIFTFDYKFQIRYESISNFERINFYYNYYKIRIDGFKMSKVIHNYFNKYFFEKFKNNLLFNI